MQNLVNNKISNSGIERGRSEPRPLEHNVIKFHNCSLDFLGGDNIYPRTKFFDLVHAIWEYPSLGSLPSGSRIFKHCFQEDSTNFFHFYFWVPFLLSFKTRTPSGMGVPRRVWTPSKKL